MKIIIEDQEMSYICDFSKKDRVVDGWLEEYHPKVDEAVDITMELLSCVYDREDIAKYLHQHIPAMDYWEESE